MDIAITRASPEDAAEIIALMKIIGSESDNLSFDGNGIPVTVDEEAEFLKSIGHSRNEAFFVARRDSKIIGTAHYTAFTKKRMAHRGDSGFASGNRNAGAESGRCCSVKYFHSRRTSRARKSSPLRCGATTSRR